MIGSGQLYNYRITKTDTNVWKMTNMKYKLDIKPCQVIVVLSMIVYHLANCFLVLINAQTYFGKKELCLNE